MSGGFQEAWNSEKLVSDIDQYKPINIALTDQSAAGDFAMGFTLKDGKTDGKVLFTPIFGGVSKAILGESVNIASNRELAVGADGKLLNASIGDYVVAIAQENGALNSIIKVQPVAYVKQAATLSTLEDLSDVPAYASNSEKLIRVNTAEDAAEYVDGNTLYDSKNYLVRLSRTGTESTWTASIDPDSIVSTSANATNSIDLVFDSTVLDPDENTSILLGIKCGFKTAVGDIVWGKIHDGASDEIGLITASWDIATDKLVISVFDLSGIAITINGDITTNINYIELVIKDIS